MVIFPTTRVQLLKGVPFLNNYNHTRLFNNVYEQEKYFDSLVEVEIDDATYQRINGNTLKVDFNIEQMKDINYLMFQNESKKWYYAFVISVDYVNPSTTNLTIELDVMQTFMFDFKFYKSFVEREHTQRWVNGKPTINIEEEGLNYGSEYDIVSIEKYMQYSYETPLGYKTDIRFLVMVTAESLTNPNNYGGSTIKGIPQNFYYYVFPLSDSSQIKVNGTSIANYESMLDKFITDEAYVGKLANVYVTSYFPSEGNVTYENNLFSFNSSELTIRTGNNITLAEYNPSKFDMTIKDLGYKYKDFPQYPESKLLMYPYSISEITDFKGNTFTIKNEMIQNDNLLIGIRSCIGAFPKTSMAIGFYNNKSGDYLIDNGIIDTLPNDITVVDSYSASYMQGNKNQLNAQISYTEDNAQRSIRQTNEATKLTMGQMNQNMQFQDVRNVGSSMQVAGQLVSLDFGGAVSTGLNMAQQYSDMQYAKQNAMQNQRHANENSRISAEQTIGSIEAKLSDINNIPATVSKQGGNMMFNIGNGFEGFYIIKKTIKSQYSERLSSYFSMFGNRVNTMKIPSLNSREFWNYIKTASCNIVGDIPQGYTLILKNIFDTGITLWHTNDMYNYDKENNERK